MTPLFMDFETYWSEEYTLKKLSPIEYVCDPRFEALGCAFVTASGAADWIDGPDLPKRFASIDWPNTYVVTHNALFDMMITSFRYGVKPGMYGDTLAMARNWLSHHLNSCSLANVAKFYGMPAKWETINKLKGISFEMLTQMPDLHAETAGYAIDDARKCRQIFVNIMKDGFPREELRVIDWVVRMAADPKLEWNQLALAEHLTNVVNDKAELLMKAQLITEDERHDSDVKLQARSNLLSDKIFASTLLSMGVVPPMKKSKTNPDNTIYAFAKSDKAFTALLEHEDPAVQTIVAARLGHKSTLEETRSQRLLSISRVTPHAPVPLKYSGAHTHRFSGDWGINLQNLPVRGGVSKLRQALRAPKGKVVVSIDASQIEARLNAVLSGQWDLVEQFRRGEDVYASFASEIYQMEVNKKDHPTQRFVGKTGILSLGYGSSSPVFQGMCRVQGNVQLSDAEAASIVFIYRQKYREIAANWRYGDDVVLPMLETGRPSELISGDDNPAWQAWGPVAIQKNKLALPSGNFLRYRDLHKEQGEKMRMEWVFMRGTRPIHVYGAKLVENVIQALAFIHLKEVALRVKDMTSGLLLPAHQVHDELIYVVDEGLAEMTRDLVVREMSKPPKWMPRAPLAAEGHIGPTYGDVH